MAVICVPSVQNEPAFILTVQIDMAFIKQIILYIAVFIYLDKISSEW